ncbi:MAG: helix-turn-helix domain-containing protein [Actinomycetota bacterium]|nr:helix-turn-helix domain-containing protein [Actinomycetota bacterium]
MLTVDEAARRLNVSRHTCYRLINDGTLPAERTIGGGRLRINEADVEKLSRPRPVRGRLGLADLPPDALLTSAEVASVLRCGVETVRRMVKSGRLRAHVGPGRRMRIPVAAVAEYLNSGDAYATA